jgi:hypothetical protein
LRELLTHWLYCALLLEICLSAIGSPVLLRVSLEEDFIRVFRQFDALKSTFAIVTGGCPEEFCLLLHDLVHNAEMQVFALFLVAAGPFGLGTILRFALLGLLGHEVRVLL